jgi:endonuclease/exonuclease/phosphatase family metal-dependent hydrolase
MAHSTTRRRFLALTGATLATTGVAGACGTANEPTTFATYNITDLTAKQVQTPGDEQAAAAARVIQEVRPDVLALNEIVNNKQSSAVRDVPSSPTNARAFVENYLSVPQRDDLAGIDFEHIYVPKSNTGIHSQMDLDNNGVEDDTPGDRTYGNDAYGFGLYPGQYALAIVSQYPIREEAIRSFRTFIWEDMPNDLIVRDPSYELYLTDCEAERFRLSSKTHVDVPVTIEDRTVHALLAHPTPPVFDGEGNFNGKRCHDEVRLLADYVAGENYLYDDSGTCGGLAEGESYVLLGDMNAAPGNEESLNAAGTYFVENEDFNTKRFPTSPGGAQAGSPYLTAEFGLQVDYVLPSPDFAIRDSAVVWPAENANKQGLSDDVETASDHRLVWADLSPRQ